MLADTTWRLDDGRWKLGLKSAKMQNDGHPSEGRRHSCFDPNAINSSSHPPVIRRHSGSQGIRYKIMFTEQSEECWRLGHWLTCQTNGLGLPKICLLNCFLLGWDLTNILRLSIFLIINFQMIPTGRLRPDHFIRFPQELYRWAHWAAPAHPHNIRRRRPQMGTKVILT